MHEHPIPCCGYVCEPGPIGPGSQAVRARLLQVELEVLDVREADFLQLAGAAAVVLELHLLECFDGDPLELLIAGALRQAVRLAQPQP
ncbi:hypothetical protein Z951_40945 [Streptomyces sp. PRh5]|nr:hypothetical protein Z951_40945 [Streptomyces sp. PRh5]